jgi:diacylglycerol kinase family enzyme
MSTRLPRALSRDTKRWLGPWSYPAAVMRTLRDFRPFRATLSSGAGVKLIRSIQIIVGNGVYYGGGTPVAEDAAIDVGRLDVYSVTHQPFTRLVAVALAVRRWMQSRIPEGVLSAQGEVFEVATRKAMTVSLDGEPILRTPVRFRVEPGCLPVIAPRD